MHNQFSSQKKASPLDGIRCRAAGGSAPIKKGEDCAPALWYHLNKTQLSGVSCFALRRCSSSRATLTSRLISSLAVTPIASTCSSASSEESRGFSAAPSVWRLAISPRTAVMMNCAFVSSAFNDASMSFTTSWGNLAPICCDLLLVELVDMPHPLEKCDIHNTLKVNLTKDLKCGSLIFIVNFTLIYQGAKIAKPGSVGTLTGLLTSNVMETNAMAKPQCNQTHPEYSSISALEVCHG